ncbi:MAG: GC-type dockerin domain-anchored protein [Phycisphaerales bacterium JB039]
MSFDGSALIGFGTYLGEDRSFVIVGLPTGACRPDLDGDGELTLFDFLAFQNLFAEGDLRADFDGDGVLTLFDFLAFQTAFGEGCP